MESELFDKIINRIFNNWTGLKLAVDHSMGGRNSKQLAIECMNSVHDYCLQNSNVNEYDIQDYLDDIVDEKMDTVFEDESTKEIAVILHKFLELFKAGDFQTCETEYQKLPNMYSEWLTETTVRMQQPQADESSSDEESDTPMEEDGWTVVKRK